MTELLTEHWLIGILVTIILGAIGSGLWDTALKPIGKKLGSLAFKLLTLNAKRSQDKVYADAAMGHHELPSLYVFFIAIGMIVGALSLTQSVLYTEVYKENVQTFIAAECSKVSTKESRNCVRQKAKEDLAPKLYLISLMTLFVIVILFTRFQSVNRTNLAITYYQKNLKSVRPYFSDSEFHLIEQKYSLMEEKKDYDEIMEQLNQVASENEIILPSPA